MPQGTPFLYRWGDVTMCQSQLQSVLALLCTGQRGLGVLCGATHLTLQCEPQGASLFPAPHRREASPFLTAHFVSRSVAGVASRQGALLVKLWRFCPCEKISSVQLLLQEEEGENREQEAL